MSEHQNRAIGIAVLGPEDAPANAYKQVRKALMADGATLSDAAETVWAEVNLGSDRMESPEVDARLLSEWIRGVSRQVLAFPQVGSAIGIVRGAKKSVRDQTGEVPDMARSLSGSIVAGDVLLTDEVAEMIEPLGLRSRPGSGPGALRTLLVPGLRPATGARLSGYISGAQQALAGVDFRLFPLRAFRSGYGLTANALEPGDRVQVRYQTPDACWMYLLIEQDDQLELANGGAPIRSPGQPLEGSLELAPSPTTRYVRPHLVVLHDPRPGFDALFQSARTSGNVQATIGRLGELLETQGQELFAIVAAGSLTARRN